jgi:AcrR family transcriptional regulator
LRSQQYAERVSTTPDTAHSTEARPTAQTRAATIPRGAGREAITAAAREVFAERGFHGASIRDIAKRAGLSLSALYHWHSSKQELLAALVEESMQAYFQNCDAALLEAGDDPVTRLRALVKVTVEYRVRCRFESNIANTEWRNLDPDNQRRLEAQLRPASRMWLEILEAGVASGQFHCAHPDDAGRTIRAACNAISQWYDPGGEIGLPELVERYTAIALRVADHRA